VADIIEASSGTYRSRVDGTIVLSVEIDPRFRADALALFGMPGTPLALAALKTGYAAAEEQSDKPAKKDTRGPLCREACDYCEMREFQEWIAQIGGNTVSTADCAKEYILSICNIESRKQLDMIPNAADRFIRNIRVPFMRWQRTRKAA